MSLARGHRRNPPCKTPACGEIHNQRAASSGHQFEHFPSTWHSLTHRTHHIVSLRRLCDRFADQSFTRLAARLRELRAVAETLEFAEDPERAPVCLPDAFPYRKNQRRCSFGFRPFSLSRLLSQLAGPPPPTLGVGVLLSVPGTEIAWARPLWMRPNSFSVRTHIYQRAVEGKEEYHSV